MFLPNTTPVFIIKVMDAIGKSISNCTIDTYKIVIILLKKSSPHTTGHI